MGDLIMIADKLISIYIVPADGEIGVSAKAAERNIPAISNRILVL